MINTVFLDMDGVITDFNKAVCKKFDLPYPPQTYHFFPEIRSQVNDFCGMAFWRNLEWMQDGRDILRAIMGTLGLEKVYFLTKVMPNAESASGKMMWIQDNLPIYLDRVIIMTLGVSKSFFAQSDALLIDDNDSDVDEFCKAGGRALLVPRPWNRAHLQVDQTVEVVKEFLERIE